MPYQLIGDDGPVDAAPAVYFQALRTQLQVRLTCAESTMPMTLRSADYYALRTEGRALDAELASALQGSRFVDELARRAYAYLVRLSTFLLATEDSHACGEIVDPLLAPTSAVASTPSSSSAGDSSVPAGLFWGLGIVALLGIGIGLVGARR